MSLEQMYSCGLLDWDNYKLCKKWEAIHGRR